MNNYLEAIFFTATIAAAGCSPSPQSAPPAAAASATTKTADAGGAGMRAFRDPVTGQLRAPTREELQQLPPVPAKANPPPRMIYRPDGTVGVFTQRRDAITATRRADGRIEIHDGAPATSASTSQPEQQP